MIYTSEVNLKSQEMSWIKFGLGLILSGLLQILFNMHFNSQKFTNLTYNHNSWQTKIVCNMQKWDFMHMENSKG